MSYVVKICILTREVSVETLAAMMEILMMIRGLTYVILARLLLQHLLT